MGIVFLEFLEFCPWNSVPGIRPGIRKWSTGPHKQFGITAFLCEGSGGIRTKQQNKQSGAIIIKALSKYYRGTKE